MSDSVGESWVEVVIAVELEPWPDIRWFAGWEDEALDWPGHVDERRHDGRRLYLSVREQELENAWAALKARVEATNRVYLEEMELVGRVPR